MAKDDWYFTNKKKFTKEWNDDADAVINYYKSKRNHETFEEFWEDVKAFAEQNRLATSYVEAEFIVDGEFIPVHLQFDDDTVVHPAEGEEIEWNESMFEDALTEDQIMELYEANRILNGEHEEEQDNYPDY